MQLCRTVDHIGEKPGSSRLPIQAGTRHLVLLEPWKYVSGNNTGYYKPHFQPPFPNTYLLLLVLHTPLSREQAASEVSLVCFSAVCLMWAIKALPLKQKSLISFLKKAL